MQISQFNGGLNKRLDPSLVAPNEALIYSNIDNTANTLKSAKDYSIVTPNIEARGFFYNFKNQWLSSFGERDYVEFNSKLYFTEAGKAPFKTTDGLLINNLGIAAPVPTLAFDTDGDPIFDSNISQINGVVVEFEDFVEADFLAAASEISGTLSAGTYEYRVIVYFGNEQIFSFDESITVDALSAVQFTFKTPHRKQLLKKDGSDYKLIKEGTGTLTDNGQALGAITAYAQTTDTIVSQWTYTYYNSADGTESAPAPLTNELNWPIAKKVKLYNFTPSSDTQVDKIRIYRLSEGITIPALTLEVSNTAGPFYDLNTNVDLTTILDTYTNLPPIVGLKFLTEAYGILFAVKDNTLYFSSIGQPNYWPASNGLTYGKEITGLLPISSGILVFSATGATLLTGTTPATFANVPVSKEQGCRSHKSCKLVKNIPVWISNEGICAWQSGAPVVLSMDKMDTVMLNVRNTAIYNQTYWVLLTDGSILAMDLRFGLSFKEYYFNNTLSDIGNFNSILYSNVDEKLVSLFTGEDMELTYHSPKYSEGVLTMSKVYNHIYIKATGLFTVKVLIDDEIVQQRNLDKDGKLPYDISVPAEKQRGSTIQFIIQGKGTIREIEYKALDRQNGR